MRLDIPAGTAKRFEPGETKTVTLVEIAGNKIIYGGNDIAKGPVDRSSENIERIKRRIQEERFYDVVVSPAPRVLADNFMDRETYASMFGPTTGDKVRLGDTSLWVEVEYDMVSRSVNLWDLVD